MHCQQDSQCYRSTNGRTFDHSPGLSFVARLRSDAESVIRSQLRGFRCMNPWLDFLYRSRIIILSILVPVFWLPLIFAWNAVSETHLRHDRLEADIRHEEARIDIERALAGLPSVSSAASGARAGASFGTRASQAAGVPPPPMREPGDTERLLLRESLIAINAQGASTAGGGKTIYDVVDTVARKLTEAGVVAEKDALNFKDELSKAAIDIVKDGSKQGFHRLFEVDKTNEKMNATSDRAAIAATGNQVTVNCAAPRNVPQTSDQGKPAVAPKHKASEPLAVADACHCP